jgi:hypothetical protein
MRCRAFDFVMLPCLNKLSYEQGKSFREKSKLNKKKGIKWPGKAWPIALSARVSGLLVLFGV